MHLVLAYANEHIRKEDEANLLLFVQLRLNLECLRRHKLAMRRQCILFEIVMIENHAFKKQINLEPKRDNLFVIFLRIARKGIHMISNLNVLKLRH